MSNVFLYCAALGGTCLVVQFLLLLSGVGGDHDGVGGDVGHDQGAFLKLFSLQTLTTFATFFGLVGLATERLGWSPLSVAAVATAAGGAALWGVARLMRGLAALQSQGNVDLANAVGHTASVYLRVPPHGQGHGRVLVTVQGRTVECRAVSLAREIPTGAQVKVLAHAEGDLLVVEPA
ncbi:MAG: hypothetical protein JNL08_18180 [Planctomycetes bacterium]|nr:hypothetical protein [Planctomycetota bacterium]